MGRRGEHGDLPFARQIRFNPLAAAGALLLVLVVLSTASLAPVATGAAKKSTTTQAQLAWESPVPGLTNGSPATSLTQAGSRISRTKGRANSISLTGPRGLERDLLIEARALAQRFGNANTVIDQATLELVGVERAGRIAQITKYPFSFPLSTISLGPIAAAELFGPVTAKAVRANEAVLSKTSSRLRKAQVGDTLVIRHWEQPQTLIRLRVGAVVPDDDAGSSELLISRINAIEIGFSRPSRIVAWGKIDRVASAWEELVPASYLRRSATPPNIDSVLSQAELKVTYGEFTVRRDRGRLESDPEWTKRNVFAFNYPILGRISCHRQMQVPLQRALTEIFQAGLADLIDVRDTKRSGGCYSAREIRTAKGTSGRNLSRHSWGAAVDINPSSNRFGEKPTMDPRIVYVFRRNGFAWGGTWSIPDGMHFELIGPPRITGPTLPSSTTTTSTTTSTTTTTTTATTTTTVTTTVLTTIDAAAGATATPPTTMPVGAVTTSLSTASASAKTTTTRRGNPTTTVSTRSAAPTTATIEALPPTTIPVAATTGTSTVAPAVPSSTAQPPLQEPSAGDVPA